MKQRTFKATLVAAIFFTLMTILCFYKINSYPDQSYDPHQVYVPGWLCMLTFILCLFDLFTIIATIAGYIEGDHLPESK